MKNIFVAILAIITLAACNDQFLETKSFYNFQINDTIFLTNKSLEKEVEIQIPSAGNNTYSVTMLPKWITIEKMSGEFSNGQTSIKVSPSDLNAPNSLGKFHGFIRLNVEQVGQFNIPVQYMSFGNPSVQLSTQLITAGISSSASVTISNPEKNGILYWEVNDLPNWIEINPNKGIIYPWNNQSITFTFKRENMNEGLYNHNITFKTNANENISLTISMEIKDYMNPAILTLLEGIVVDAEYCNTTNQAFVVTHTPNRVYRFDLNSREVKQLNISSVPTCVSVSDDGNKIAIGTSNARVLVINATSVSLEKDYEIDCIPFDIALSNNNWAYISPTLDQWVYFRNINLSTGQVIKSKNSTAIYEKTILKKIPGKDNLVGTRLTLSPTGIMLFDISEGICNENINYWHESIGKFWITDDGKKIICANGKVLPIHDYSSQPIHEINISPIGELFSGWEWQIQWADHNQEANKIYTVRANPNYSGKIDNSWIEIYDAFNYSKIKSIETSPYTLTVNGTKNHYETHPLYVFAGKDKTVFYALKRIKPNYNVGDYWSIEKITL